MTQNELSDALAATAGLFVFLAAVLIGLVYAGGGGPSEKWARFCIGTGITLLGLVVLMALTSIWTEALL